MNKIENEIINYFLAEFGRSNLSAIRIKPIELKYKDQLDFINNKLKHQILESVTPYKYFPKFETLVQANSAYKIKLVKDIDSIFPHLRKLYENPDVDEVRTTFSNIFDNVDLTEKRLFECLYYLTNSSGFVINTFSVKDEKVILDIEKTFYLSQELNKYNSFNDYLEETKSSWQRTDLQEKTTSRKLTPRQIDVEITQKNASELWALYPNKRVAQMIRDHREDLLKGCTYQKCADSTLRTRIAYLHPNPENSKGGRDKKPKNKNRSSMSDLLKT